MLEFRESTENVRVRDLRYQEQQGRRLLSWSFRSAEGFLILEKNYGAADTQDIRQLLTEQLGDILRAGSREFEGGVLFYVTAAKFANMNYQFPIPQQLLLRGAAEFLIFACAKTEGGLAVYGTEDLAAHRVMKKNRVVYSMQEKTSFFGKTATVKLSLPVIEGYQDYGLVYRLSYIPGYLYPVTREMLGKTVEFTVPKGESVELRMSELGSKMYDLSMRAE